MATDDYAPHQREMGLDDIRVERTTRALARIEKRLGLVLLLVALPYLLFAAGLMLALLVGDVQVGTA